MVDILVQKNVVASFYFCCISSRILLIHIDGHASEVVAMYSTSEDDKAMDVFFSNTMKLHLHQA